MNDKKALDYLKPILMGTIFGIILISVLFLIFALMVSKLNMPVPSISIIVTICGGLGSFVSGFVSSKIFKKKGILIGILSGLILSLLILILSIVFSGNILGGESISKYIVILISSILGGVLGVNSKSYRK